MRQKQQQTEVTRKQALKKEKLRKTRKGKKEKENPVSRVRKVN